MKNTLPFVFVFMIASCDKDRKHHCIFLENSHIEKEIQDYMDRSNKSKKGLYYISCEQLDDSCQFEMSSIVFKSQFDDLKPCSLLKMNNNFVLIKCGKRDNSSHIYHKIKSSLLINNKETISIDFNGDTIIHHTDLLYNPEVLHLKYKN